VHTFRTKSLLVATFAGVLAAGSVVGIASAQSLSPEPSSTLVQTLQNELGRLVLANEASAVAQLLGISIEQLQQELVGHSLAQVAANHGKSADDVNTVLLDTADGQVDQAVALGLMSPDDGANLKSEIATVTPALVQLPLGNTDVPNQ
jgi:hypothetical protein